MKPVSPFSRRRAASSSQLNQNKTGRYVKLRERLGIHIYVLPNLLTTCNMFFGFFSIVYAIKGDFMTAAYAIVAAAVFDLLDGRVARLTHTTSHFGAEYDSLSDVISFGVAPSLLMYLWALQPFGRIGWLAAFFFVACGALRLARFNVQAQVSEKKDFQGLPIPMAAGIVAGSQTAFTDLGLEGSGNLGLLLMTFLLAFVMVSTFRYRSFKDLNFKRLPFIYLVAGVLLIAVVAWRAEVMLFVVFLSYAVIGAVLGVRNYGKQRVLETKKVFVDGNQTFETDLHEEIDDDYSADSIEEVNKDENSKGRPIK
jgi:CDP-diacylglycerol--serine O-phosphatidyltransferase